MGFGVWCFRFGEWDCRDRVLGVGVFMDPGLVLKKGWRLLVLQVCLLCVRHAVLGRLLSVEKATTLKKWTDFYLKAKARIRP